MYKSLFILCFIWSSFLLNGQDLNQTNYSYSPLYLNPANTGGFYGSLRIGGSYRDQGVKLMGEGYKTGQLFADMPINFGFRKQDWIAVGVHAFNDKSGSLFLNTTGLLGSIAYHYSLEKTQRNVISLGVQYGNIQKKIDIKNIIVETRKKDIDVLQDYNTSYADFSLGLNYRSRMKKGQIFELGLSLFHVLKPKYKGIDRQNFIDRRISINSFYHYRLNDRIFIRPELITSFSNKFFNIVTQFKTYYKLKKDTRSKKTKEFLYIGIGYRLQDAIEVMLGMNYKDYNFGISYDITVSSAAAYNNRQGGLEFGVYKIINILKRPKVKPIIFCPRL